MLELAAPPKPGSAIPGPLRRPQQPAGLGAGWPAGWRHLRRRQRGELQRCHTVEPGSLLPGFRARPGSAAPVQLAAARNGAANGASTTDTFQQLRQAALTSLDFAYDNADESSDFDDANYEEDASLSEQASHVAVAGRAIYEVRPARFCAYAGSAQVHAQRSCCCSASSRVVAAAA